MRMKKKHLESIIGIAYLYCNLSDEQIYRDILAEGDFPEQYLEELLMVLKKINGRFIPEERLSVVSTEDDIPFDEPAPQGYEIHCKKCSSVFKTSKPELSPPSQYTCPCGYEVIPAS